MAKLIEKHATAPIKILVDYPISYKLEDIPRAKTIYPDITLVRENTILAIIEAKIDLGFLKDDWASNRGDTLEALKSSGEITIDRTAVSVAKTFSSCCVVLTAQNNRGRLAGFLEQPINPIVLILEDHLHPNDDNVLSDDGYFSRVTACSENHKQWAALENFLVRVI